MTRTNDKLPLVSFVVAAYNAEKYISLSLSSIQKQTYPKKAIEILVIDGGSSDRTVEITQTFGAKVLDNPDRIAEFAKSIGIQHAKGEYIVILDTDNEIVQTDWLEKNIAVLETDVTLLGMDPLFLVRSGDFLINRYCALLTTEDPIIRCLATVQKNSFRENKDYYSVHIVKPGRFPIFGSNGFIWRKSVLEDVGGYIPRFDEADFCVRAVEKGYNRIGFIKGYGIFHHHLETFAQYMGKRFRRGREFMTRKLMTKETKKIESGVWLDKYSKWEFFKSIFLCSSLIYPLYESIKGYIKDRDVAWVLHPFLSLASVVTYGMAFLKYIIFR